MKLTKTLIIFTILTFFLFNVTTVSAFFSWNHEKFIVQGFNEVDSAITRECKPYLAEFIDGETSADTSVVHYYDTGANSKITSYISTHTKGAGREACLNEAGTDIRKKCYCYGMGMHSIQDQFSHLNADQNGQTDGLVVKYLKTYFAPNFIGHMTIEKNFETKSKAKLLKENPTLYEQVKYYDDRVLDTMFRTENGALVPSDLTQLFADSTGIDPVNDIKLFRSGYLNKGFYSTVYKDKVKLPSWAYYISFSLMIIGFGLAILLISTGKNKTKYLASIMWIIVGIIGVVIFYSFYTGTTWQITSYLIEVPAKVGYLSVSDADIIKYDQLAQASTNQYLKDGILTIADASGLDYIDSNGIANKGALNDASKIFFYIFWIVILPLFLFINYKLFTKAYKRK